MLFDEFKTQVDRLAGHYGNIGFGPEFRQLLWAMVGGVDSGVFKNAVDKLILTCRQRPMGTEIEAAVAEAKAVWNANRFPALQGNSPLEMLESAEKQNTLADKDFVKACVQVVRDNTAGRLKGARFIEACDALDELAHTLRSRCRDCQGDGYVVEQRGLGRFLSRCNCSAGKRRPEKAFGPTDRNGNRVEFSIPELQTKHRGPSLRGELAREKQTGEHDE